MRTRLVGALAAVALALIGCGDDDPAPPVAEPALGPFQAVVAQTAGLDSSARTARLLELARAEKGPFSTYTTLNADLGASLEAGFEAMSGVDVTTFRNGDDGVLQRLTQEQAAGKPGADVVVTGGITMGLLDSDGLLERHGVEGLALVPGAVKPTWVAVNLSSLVVAWNTDLVAPADVPKAWEDLADPRWKGRLAMEVSDWMWFAGLRDYWVGEGGKSAEEADRLFEAMVANARVVSGHTLMGQLLAAGEVDVVASQYLNVVERDIKAGAPVAWEPPVQPLVSNPQGVGLVVGSARPATALLYLDWIVRDGQELFLEPTRADLATEASVRTFLVDVESLVATSQEWSDRYDRLVTTGHVS